ncbi:MAG TPA: CBS domain-containing protein [Myxococcota bacterium]|nr:CBS domain-containing protein [Myxococcota bacterium]
MKSVAELMTVDPTTVEPKMAAVSALELMISDGVRHLPVLDRKKRVCGIVSIDDLRAALPFVVSIRRPPTVEEHDDALGYTVGEVMTHGPLTIDTGASLAEAAGLLARFRIGCLPVVDRAGHLVGIFSETDALRALAGESPEPAAERRRVHELQRLLRELELERERIADRLGKLQQPEPDPQASELEDPLASLAARRLASIEHALARGRAGRLGTCEECGDEIAVARLRALPGATRCVRCAGARESR